MSKRLTPNNGGKKYLEQCPKISIKELYEHIRKETEKQILSLEVEDVNILSSPAQFGGFRLWFECPICKKRVFGLYQHQNSFMCRCCTGLCYQSQRYKGMLEKKFIIPKK